jgi:predicted lipoprotein with Yx(FWY)xxD motif
MKKTAIALATLLSALAASAALASSTSAISTARTSLGTVLVNSKGLTLYLFEGDSGSKLACNGGCLKAWPPISGSAVAKGAVQASMLGTVKRGSGTQVTYGRHPLYTFSGDSRAGQVNGEGLKLNGKFWYAVSPSGKAMIASKGAGGAGTPKPAW